MAVNPTRTIRSIALARCLGIIDSARSSVSMSAIASVSCEFCVARTRGWRMVALADESSGMTQVRAVMVNHNTSAWAELATRSLYAQQPALELALTIYDNTSTDDQVGLRQAARELGVPIVPSGLTTDTPNNSHGEVLRRFVLDAANAACAYYLFLDADVCFTQPGTVDRLLECLDRDGQAFGAGPRMSWDGETVTAAKRWLERLGRPHGEVSACCGSFSVWPPAEPDVPGFPASGSLVTEDT